VRTIRTVLVLGLALLALVPARAFGQATFTIQEITPDQVSWRVSLFFSHPVALADLKPNLSIFPQIPIDWEKSKLVTPQVLSLAGDFKPGQRHLVSLPQGLKSNGLAYRPTKDSFVMPDLKPRLEFLDQGSVIERDSRQMLHLRLVNLDRLRMESLRVPPLLLPLALAAAGRPAGEDFLRLTAVMEEALAELATLRPRGLDRFVTDPHYLSQLFSAGSEKNQVRAFSVPLSFRPQKEKGSLELIRVFSQEAGPQGPGTGPRLFRVTDLSLTYKLSRGELLVWATSLKSGLPLEGVSILAFTKEMEAFVLGRTDPFGLLSFQPRELEGLSLRTRGGFKAVTGRPELNSITLLAAAGEDDASFIALRPRGNLKPEGVVQAPRGSEADRPLRGHIFTERGVYRPGETVHYKATVRRYEEGRIISPAGRSCTILVLNSLGEEVLKYEPKLSEFGTAAGELELKPYFPLGTYTLTLVYGPAEQDRLSGTFQVQEFRPPRHYAEVTFDYQERRDESMVNRPRMEHLVRINLAGLYFAGGPVKHGRVRYRISPARTSFSAPGFDGYTFGYQGGEEGLLLESGEAVLDEHGRLSLEFPLEEGFLTGRQGLQVTASVIDFDGRTSSASGTFQLDPDYLVGLGPRPDRIRAGVTQKVDLVVLDSAGRRLRRGAVEARVMQESGAYIRKRNQAGDVYWEYQPTWRNLWSQELTLSGGRAEFSFDFTWGGAYLVEATFRDDQGRAFTSAAMLEVEGDIHWEAYWNREKPFESLALVADREIYAPGQTARIFFQPLKNVSRYLVTLEQDRILEHRVVEARAGAQSLEIPIKAGHAPNLFVSVLGVTPRGRFPGLATSYDLEAPSFIFGTVNLPVRQETGRLEVELGPQAAELKAEPGSKVDLEVLVKDQDGAGARAEVALAVVDEAVLSLTAFQTPDLEGLNRFDLPLAVFTGELRRLLLHQTPFSQVLNRSLTGGDGMAEAGEGEADLRQDFNPVAFFDPAIRTDGQGRARVSFTLPDSLTRYRVYAVACDQGPAYGRAERSLTAALEFYLEPGLPRFLTRGDSFSFGLKAFNNTGQAGQVDLRLQASQGLSLTGPPEPLAVPAKDSALIPLSGRALEAGPAWIRLGGRLGGLKDEVKIELPVRSEFLRTREAFFGRFQGKKEIDLGPALELRPADLEKIKAGEVECLLTVSGSPFLNLGPALDYLLRYPYGCLEQTSSAVMPLASLRGLIKEGLFPGRDPAATDKFLAEGVARLLAMQTFSGGFGYWPGHSFPHPWGTVYAVAALSAAQESGFPVPERMLEKALKYLKGTLKQGPRSETYRAFVAYLLGINKTLDRATLTLLSREFDQQPREARLLLLLAGVRSGLTRVEEAAPLARRTLTASPAADQADEFQARFREPALALLAASAILPGDPLTDLAAARLTAGMGPQGIWSSTSDTGWSLLALGRHFQGQKFPSGPVRLKINQPGRPSQELSLEPRGFARLSLDPGAFLRRPVVELESDVPETLLYQLLVARPRPDQAQAGAENGFLVSKRIDNVDGTGTVKVGDLVEVRVRIEARGRPGRYVILDDPLPAGLVAINTALATEEEAGGSSLAPSDRFRFSQWNQAGFYNFQPHFFQIKDDRVVAFRNQVWPGVYEFSYVARAVCAGEFVLPPTRVELMYDPQVNGFTPASTFTVEPR